jgi:hypothetical protein
MEVDPEKLRAYVASHYLVQTAVVGGDQSEPAVRAVLAGAWEVYERFEERELEAKGLSLFRSIDDLTPTPSAFETVVGGFSDIPRPLSGPLALQLMADGRIYVLETATASVQMAATPGVLYQNRSGLETLSVRNVPVVLEKQRSGASIFAVPAFRDLRKALRHYADEMVLTSQCAVFAGTWDSDRRLFFKKRPESLMRDSLKQFLKSHFYGGNVEVKAESVVDDSHPVDLRVTFYLSRRIGLIEIKWVGKSRSSTKKSITTTFSDSRAREGADQLAQYLDANHEDAPSLLSRGYLVVIDGRRRGLKASSTDVDDTNGLYYRSRELRYHPKHHEIRDDFEPPIRMFAEPWCR